MPAISSLLREKLVLMVSESVFISKSSAGTQRMALVLSYQILFSWFFMTGIN